MKANWDKYMTAIISKSHSIPEVIQVYCVSGTFFLGLGQVLFYAPSNRVWWAFACTIWIPLKWRTSCPRCWKRYLKRAFNWPLRSCRCSQQLSHRPWLSEGRCIPMTNGDGGTKAWQSNPKEGLSRRSPLAVIAYLTASLCMPSSVPFHLFLQNTAYETSWK